ncbi:8746_t:CDS:2 [Entrophospora sp. SA101]|nr:8746_t:CDS:2 [Entrophospora sp. SA101]
MQERTTKRRRKRITKRRAELLREEGELNTGNDELEELKVVGVVG